MKNTSRIHWKNNPKKQSSQGKKPTIHGQNSATIGQAEINTEGKVTLGAVRVGGEAIGLNENEIKALALLADHDEIKVTEYCRKAVAEYMQASYTSLLTQGREAKSPQERELIIKALVPLDGLFLEPAEGWRREVLKPATPICMFDAKSLLEEAVRQSEAFQVLMLNTIESECVGIFRNDRGYLAAGIQTLMFHVRDDLDNARDAVREASKTLNS